MSELGNKLRAFGEWIDVEEGWLSAKNKARALAVEADEQQAKLELQRVALKESDDCFSNLQDEHQELHTKLEQALELLDEIALHLGMVPGQDWRDRWVALATKREEQEE